MSGATGISAQISSRHGIDDVDARDNLVCGKMFLFEPALEGWHHERNSYGWSGIWPRMSLRSLALMDLELLDCAGSCVAAKP
jgi:hypothetical protein